MDINNGLSAHRGILSRNRWALLIGVNQYVDPAIANLRFCVRDVLALENQLVRLGYTVRCLHDQVGKEHLLPTRDNIEGELTRLCQAAQPDDLLMVYFSGHGTLVDGKPAILTREVRESMIRSRALLLSSMETQIRSSRARRQILILDACHAGVQMGRAFSDAGFITAAYELAEGFALIAASTAQQTALEWTDGEHGVFTYYLLQGLTGAADLSRKGFVTVDDVKTYVLAEVSKWSITHDQPVQLPTARTEGFGDIILADYRTQAPLPPSQPIQPPRILPSVLAPAHVQSAGLPAWQDNMGLTIVPDNVRRIEQLAAVRCESDESSYDGFWGVLGDGLQVALIASPFGRRAAYVFDLTTGKKTHETRDFLTLSPDCRFAATRLDSVPGEPAFNVAVLDTSSWRSVREFRQKGGRGWSVAFSTDNSSLALIFSLENLLKKATVLEVRAIVSGTAVLRMNLPAALQGIPEFVSDRELLLCTPDSVALLDILSGKTVWTLAVPREGIIGMDRSRSQLYVKMQNDHRTHVVHVHTGRDILVLDKMELPLQSRRTLVTPDGQMIVDHDENLLTFFSTWTGERLYQLPLSRCHGLHFTPSGRALLVLYYNEIRILGVRA